SSRPGVPEAEHDVVGIALADAPDVSDETRANQGSAEVVVPDSVAPTPPATRPRQHRRWLPAVAAFTVVSVVVAIYAIALGRTDSTLSGKQPVIAVGSISDYASPDSTGIGTALRDMLATNLARSRDLTVVSGARLLELEHQMDGGAAPAPGAIVPAARQAGAPALVAGPLYPMAHP